MFTQFNDHFKKTALSTLLKYFLELWSYLYKDVESTDVSKYTDKINTLDLISNNNNNTFYILFDSRNFKTLYCSKNIVNVTGYEQEEMMAKSLLLLFETFETKQLPFLFKTFNWVNFIQKYNTVESFMELVQYQWVGLTYTDKNGQKKRSLIEINPLELDDKGFHRLFIVTFHNITHLMRDELSYFARVEIGKTNKSYSSFFNDTKPTTKDILTSRELEILKLIVLNKDSKEIGDDLFISKFTVDRHRKNMVSRLGARDTFALIEICRMCNIV